MVTLQDIRFRYTEGGFRLEIPRLEIARGSRTAVVGPSGSGKTTFLRLLSGISVPDSGEIRVGSNVVSNLDDSARRNFRISEVGFIFQEFELIDYLNVLENILLPYFINRSMQLDASVRRRAAELAESMGLGTMLKRGIEQMSQGEKQRVAICRALLVKPQVILADEPTGNLDPINKGRIVELLFERTAATGATLVMVTHDHSLLNDFDRVIDFDDLRAEVAE